VTRTVALGGAPTAEERRAWTAVLKGHSALARAVFPAGTVSGAPKVRAVELVAALEPSRRGVYAGAVGCFGFDGTIDTAIAIRTLLVARGGV
jgi:anthranilate/para-aminobenzoate synthase component I